MGMSSKLLGCTIFARQLFFKWVCLVNFGLDVLCPAVVLQMCMSTFFLKILAYNYLKVIFFRLNNGTFRKRMGVLVWFGYKREWWMQQSG
jgi:hypothetical protein